MLHDYLDKEQKDISSKRQLILEGIRSSPNAFLADKCLDVGVELDESLSLLDSGRPDRAQARIAELLKKIRNNYGVLERRVEDLKKHERSLNIFLAAIADRNGKFGDGLILANEALASDSRDFDALKLKGHLLIKTGELELAEQMFEKIRVQVGSSAYRAEAYLGSALVNKSRGPRSFDQADQALLNASRNLNRIAVPEQDFTAKATVYETWGDLYATKSWRLADDAKAISHYQTAAESIKKLRLCEFTKTWEEALAVKILDLQPSANCNEAQPNV